MNQHQSVFSRYAALAVILLASSGVACKPTAQTYTGNGGAGGSGNGQGGSGNGSGGVGGSSTSQSSAQGGNAGAAGGASNRGGSGGSGSGGAGGVNSNNGGAGGANSSGGAGGASSSNGGGASSNGGAGGVSNGGTTSGGGAGGTTVAKSACGDGTLPANPTMPGYPAASHTQFQSQASAMATNMSTTELAGQMRGTNPGSATARNWNDIFRQLDNTTRGIKGYAFRDGPRGVNLDAPIQATGVSHGTSTVFPVAAARGATFDVGLEYRIGQALGDEMVAAGQTMLLAPTVNILRHPLWGRAQETYGEDSFLLGRMGSSAVAGIQQYVAACVKHYAGNNVEDNRATNVAAMADEQTLREVYARHFQMIVQDGGVACVMAAYNLVQVGSGSALNCTQNTHLLTDILRTDFGFQGFVLSDWWAMPGGDGSQNTSLAAPAISAGLDMELPWNWDFANIDSSGSGVTSAQLKTSAMRILEQKFRFKADKGTGLQAATTGFSGGSITNNSTHIATALEAAQESMVLLKNNNNTLPIKSTVTKVAVVGAKLDYWSPVNTSGVATGTGINNRADDVNNGTIDFANGIRIGDVGSSRADPDLTKSVGPCAGIQAAAGSSVTVTCGNTASVAAGADFVVVVAGLTPYDEGEEYNGSGDRCTAAQIASSSCSFALDGKPSSNANGNNTNVQNGLIAGVVALGKPMVVVLEGGSAIDMSKWLSTVPAVVMAWYPGMVGGTALGQLLFGQKNFSGKLPISWPNALSDLPTFNGGTSTTMDYYLGYRYFDHAAKTPLYPFGYGMSYTSFAYSNLVVPCGTTTKNSVVNVSVDVTNTGTVAGDEIVMLFVSFPNTTARRSVKELKGFARVTLAAGAKQTVTIPVRVSDLKYYDNTNGWTVESGTVKVMVGGSSANLPLSDTFTVN